MPETKNPNPSEHNWTRFHEKTEKNSPRALLVESLQYVEEKGKALDLGAGSLRDSEYLIAEGFERVTAVDKTPSVAERNVNEKIDVIISTFEDVDLPENTYDLINAQFTLPFIHSEKFENTLKKIIDSLKPGGVMNGQFFGERDSWSGNPEMTFLTEEKAREILGDLDEIKFTEDERDGTTTMGEKKHWHLFNFIARKK